MYYNSDSYRDTDAEAAAAIVVVASILRNKNKNKHRKKRETWVKPYLFRRNHLGAYETLCDEFRRENVDEYNNFFFMFYIPHALIFLPLANKRLIYFFFLKPNEYNIFQNMYDKILITNSLEHYVV